MIALASYPRLRAAMTAYLEPRGLPLARDAQLPPGFAKRVEAAEAELACASPDDLMALASEDDAEHEAMAVQLPLATDFVVLAWEGQLGLRIFG